MINREISLLYFPALNIKNVFKALTIHQAQICMHGHMNRYLDTCRHTHTCMYAFILSHTHTHTHTHFFYLIDTITREHYHKLIDFLLIKGSGKISILDNLCKSFNNNLYNLCRACAIQSRLSWPNFSNVLF